MLTRRECVGLVVDVTESIVCCTYSNGKTAFNLCEDDGSCPLLSGYQLINKVPTSNCLACTGSANKRQLESRPGHVVLVK